MSTEPRCPFPWCNDTFPHLHAPMDPVSLAERLERGDELPGDVVAAVWLLRQMASTDEVMAAGVDVIRSYRALDVFSGASVRAVTDAEVRWSELMRAWMDARGIEQ